MFRRNTVHTMCAAVHVLLATCIIIGYMQYVHVHVLPCVHAMHAVSHRNVAIHVLLQ